MVETNDPLGTNGSNGGGAGDFISDARNELAGMLQDGMNHPSTKPVLAWAIGGAVAAAVLPFVTIPIGLAAGAGYQFYKRVRPD